MSNDYLRASTDEDASALLVNHLSQPIPQGHFVRELTQNAIEAIQERGGDGRVRWQADRESWPAPKLQIVDNGIGFDPDEMEKIQHELFVSTKRLGLQGNFGVGGRIATVRNSPAGIVYDTWRGGEGYRCVMEWPTREKPPRLRVGESGQRVRALEEEHPWGDQSGTRVTIIGHSLEDDTTTNPGGSLSGGPMRWVFYYLNRRYLCWPEGVDVFVEEPPSEKRMQAFRVKGLIETLDHISTSGGSVVVGDGVRADWWILEEDNYGFPYTTPAHLGVAWGSELHDATFSGAQKTHRFGYFGVRLATSRVAIHIRPSEGGWNPNAQRTHLLPSDGSAEGVPWEQWGNQFRDHFPAALEELERELHADAFTSFDSQSWYDILRQMGLLDFQRFFGSKGTTLAGEEIADMGPHERSPSGVTNVGNSPDQSEPSIFEEGTKPRTPKHPKGAPRVVWSKDADTDGELARYVISENELICDSSHYQVVKLSHLIARHANGNASLAPAASRQLVARRLVEYVLLAEQQKHHGWDRKRIEDAWSPSALTAVMLPLYETIQDGLDLIRTKRGREILSGTP